MTIKCPYLKNAKECTNKNNSGRGCSHKKYLEYIKCKYYNSRGVNKEY